MKINSTAKIALEKYLRILEEIRVQENKGIDEDPDGIGFGADEELFEELAQAKDGFNENITPSDYAGLLEEIALHRKNVCELIMENVALKATISRLGGNPDFIGNIDASGKA
ncbi:hypothetical protein JY446_23175 [Serratia marcescens]|nr:hypothetical protein [Serratia marcescens]